MYFSKQQIKFLKKLDNKNIYYWRDPSEIEFEYLQSMGLVENPKSPVLTEKGRAVIYDYYTRKKEIWIPVIFSSILSIIAIVISIIALLL